MKRRPAGDDGASLLIVLVFMILISVITLALLDFTNVSFQAAGGVRTVRQQNYAADAAIELGIKKVATDTSGGLAACPYTITGMQGQTSVVQCAQNGSTTTGSGTHPANAILTTSSASDSFDLSGQYQLTVDGPLYSWGGIKVDKANNSQLLASYPITAEGDNYCSDDTRVLTNPTTYKKCSWPSSQRSARGGDVPVWDAEALVSTLTNPAPVCLPTDTLAVFSPGLYTQNPATLADNCGGRDTLYFTPGVYYFSGAGLVTGSYQVVGGEPAGTWYATRTTPPADGTACLASSLLTTQFVFGRGAGLSIGNASSVTAFTLCAGPSGSPTTRPPIAIWGASTGFGVTTPSAFGSCPTPPKGCSTNAGPITGVQKANVFVDGSIYAPSSLGDLWMKVKQESLYNGGLVLNTLTVNVSASTTQSKSPFQLPGCLSYSSGCAQTRNIVFTATDGATGPVRTRAIVQYTGLPASAPTSYKILSWSVLR